MKTTEVDVNGITLKVAVLSGLRNVRNFFDQGGWENYHLIEVMACPGGCINGGGQLLRRRMAAGSTDEESLSH